MPPSLSRRVEILEEKMVTLEAFRDEMRTEFSAVRQELGAHGEALSAVRQELGAHGEALSAVRQELRSHSDALAALREGVSDLGTHMRVLHEDVVTRISLLQEGAHKRDAGEQQTNG